MLFGQNNCNNNNHNIKTIIKDKITVNKDKDKFNLNNNINNLTKTLINQNDIYKRFNKNQLGRRQKRGLYLSNLIGSTANLSSNELKQFLIDYRSDNQQFKLTNNNDRIENENFVLSPSSDNDNLNIQNNVDIKNKQFCQEFFNSDKVQQQQQQEKIFLDLTPQDKVEDEVEELKENTNNNNNKEENCEEFINLLNNTITNANINNFIQTPFLSNLNTNNNQTPNPSPIFNNSNINDNSKINNNNNHLLNKNPIQSQLNILNNKNDTTTLLTSDVLTNLTHPISFENYNSILIPESLNNNGEIESRNSSLFITPTTPLNSSPEPFNDENLVDLTYGQIPPSSSPQILDYLKSLPLTPTATPENQDNKEYVVTTPYTPPTDDGHCCGQIGEQCEEGMEIVENLMNLEKFIAVNTTTTPPLPQQSGFYMNENHTLAYPFFNQNDHHDDPNSFLRKDGIPFNPTSNGKTVEIDSLENILKDYQQISALSNLSHPTQPLCSSNSTTTTTTTPSMLSPTDVASPPYNPEEQIQFTHQQQQQPIITDTTTTPSLLSVLSSPEEFYNEINMNAAAAVINQNMLNEALAQSNLYNEKVVSSNLNFFHYDQDSNGMEATGSTSTPSTSNTSSLPPSQNDIYSLFLSQDGVNATPSNLLSLSGLLNGSMMIPSSTQPEENDQEKLMSNTMNMNELAMDQMMKYHSIIPNREIKLEDDEEEKEEDMAKAKKFKKTTIKKEKKKESKEEKNVESDEHSKSSLKKAKGKKNEDVAAKEEGNEENEGLINGKPFVYVITCDDEDEEDDEEEEKEKEKTKTNDDHPSASHHKKKYKKKYFVCSVCHHKSKRHYNIEVHLKTHEKNRPREFKCDICEKRFCRSHDLERHKVVHKEKMFECRLCHKKFGRMDSLKRHIGCKTCIKRQKSLLLE